jgi:glycosyltransferase involved in cell wall biosynthesis
VLAHADVADKALAETGVSGVDGLPSSGRPLGGEPDASGATNGGAEKVMPRKVVVVAYDSAELSLRLAGALGTHCRVRLLLPERAARAHLKWLTPDVDFRPFSKPRLRQPIRQLFLLRRVYRQIMEFESDVIHFQKGHLWFNLALAVLRRRVPVVVSIHDPVHHLGDASSRRTPQWIMHFLYRRADRAIAHNVSMKQEIIEKCRIPADRIHVVPLIERGDADAGPQVDEEEGTILFFGRIWPYKGLEYLIEAEPLITSRVPCARIIIAGQGENLARYFAMMRDPSRYVVYNEYVSSEKQAELFRRASVVVLPYVEATQSGVIPVAYTHQKPVVASAVGGLGSQVEHGRTGYLVAPKDSVALAARVSELLEDEPLRRELGMNGWRKQRREWAAPIVAAKTLDVSRLAMRDRRHTSARQ